LCCGDQAIPQMLDDVEYMNGADMQAQIAMLDDVKVQMDAPSSGATSS